MSDLSDQASSLPHAAHRPMRAGAMLGVLGIVYGDIGTSPLYALKATLALFGGRPISDWEVLGCLSLIFWSLILIVTVKYVLLVMRADNRGEGGILALMALAQRVAGGEKVRAALGLNAPRQLMSFRAKLAERISWDAARAHAATL